MDNVKTGIVVLNYNTPEETLKCVESIRKYTSIRYKIFVVDNKSTDDSAEKLSKRLKEQCDVQFIQSSKNGGYSAGNNIGVKAAIEDKCDVIYIMNSDVELTEDALTRMNKVLLSNDKYMIIGPRVINNDGNDTQVARKKVTLKTFIFSRHPFVYFRIFDKISNRKCNHSGHKVFSFDGCVMGCCLGVRASDFERIKYFDENIFLYGEESILTYKMEKLDKLAVYDKGTKIWHKESISTKKRGNAFIQFHSWNSGMYILKNYCKASRIALILIAIWNSITWISFSIVSAKHRSMLKDFIHTDWRIALSSRNNILDSIS